jgi:GntR family transcriptional repressor for pyruvate dehydrogenase complex
MVFNKEKDNSKRNDEMKSANKSVKQGNPSTQTYSKRIADRIIEDIINGKYLPDSKLPTEREMSKTFEVTRHVIREALKRVESWGLVSIQQGSGAKVNNYKTSGGIELIEYLLTQDKEVVNIDFILKIFEYHEILSIGAIQLAARRITEEELNQFESLVKKRGGCTDNEEKAGLTLEISRAILEGSKNTCIQLTFNSVIRMSHKFLPFFNLTYASPLDYQKFFERLVEFFKEGDHEMAALLATRYFNETKHYFNENKSYFIKYFNDLISNMDK